MNKSANRFPFVLAVAICLCLSAMLLGSPLSAQSTFGSVSGSVADASGSAVPDAQVTLTSTATSAKQTYTTGGDGLYSFVNLNPGDYRLDVEKAGFKHYKRESVFVQVQQNIRIDIALEVGAVNQTVEVTAETPLLQPTDTSLGQVVDERKTNEIPLNGRNVFSLITLSPAAIAGGSGSGSATGGSQVGPNPFSWGNYQVGGSFGNESAEYIDGQPVNIGYINLPVLIPDQDAISEFKVQYNNLGPEWGKFAGGIVNLSTKGGTNQFHGEAYEYLRNKVLNSTPYFVSSNPPYVQNQFGGTVGGPVIKDHTFFFFAYDGYRQRASTVFTTTVPTVGERAGVFPTDVPIFDPLSVSAACLAPGGNTAANCGRTQFVNNTIPVINPAALEELKFIALPTNANEVNNFTAAGASGGNANQYVGRVDQNLSSTQHIFARYNFFNLLDLPLDPFGTGLCADKCAETYQTNALAIDYSYTIRPDLILNINASGSRFHYARTPSNSSFDLTQFGWPAAYNAEIPSAARSPFTPCFTPQDPSVTCSQGQSFIADHDTQVNVSPNLTWIKGRHTWVFGGQLTETYDNYAQTNIASGAFAFNGSWTADNAVAPTPNTGISFADFLLGYGLNQSSVFNHNYGEAQIPALVAQKETYRGFYFGDTWRVTQKLTINYGVRYDLPGNWSVRHDLSTYLDPSASNRTVTGCQQNPATGFGVPGSPCPGDVFFVGTGINPGRTAVPLYKKEFMPRVGIAYSWDQKTVIRAGYGIFFIPNWVLFNLNPSNDPINTSSTLWVATTNSGLSPNSTLTATNCALTPGVASPESPSGTLTCPTNGPFGPSLNVPLTRQGNVSQFDAGGNPFEAPYRAYSPGYVQQFNLDIQRQLPFGIFVDAAYAGSRGVHLSSSNNVSINNIPDSFYAQAQAQENAGEPVTITTPVPNPFTGITTVSGLNPTTNATIPAGQLDRPYPEYTGLSLVGDGCCGSNYNSFQLTATKRFKDGGSLLAAYTNAKLMSNTDTLTTWLETGVGSPQDWNNLKGERSLSSQDVSQRLVISYVYDLPFGHGQRYMSDASGPMEKVISGWGVDGVTSFQKGFPLPISFGGSNQISQAGFSQNFQLRPNVTPGCDKNAAHTIAPGTTNNIVWFNASCFTPPADWGFGDESRVDASLREAGINNWDIALFKTTNFGPEERLGLQFRAEFFNAFNRVQFGPPGTSLGSGSFGIVSSQLNNPRLIQFGLKFLF
ncbi:MAG TPA: TonB-dependent receptor [Candidatus Acidoferrales bacterium]|nr:TonB-dependent receptor [Candidatus Acidoferrales bacterium]